MKVKNFSRICLIISGCVMLIALVMAIFGAGINPGIDFAGGLTIQYEMNQAFDHKDVEDALNAQGLSGCRIARSGESGLQIRVPSMAGEAEIQTLQSGLEATLLKKYPGMDTETATARYEGPVAGAGLVRNTGLCVLLIMALALVYIAIRFGFSSGVAAVLGILHDLLIVLSFTVLLRGVLRVNVSFAAAMLAVAGYSIVTAIALFDRVRENNEKPGCSKMKKEDVVNLSVGENLDRTVHTTLTALILLVALCILGVTSVREVSLPIVIGVLSSVYSANMIDGYVWAFLEERRKGKKGAAKKGAKLKAKKA